MSNAGLCQFALTPYVPAISQYQVREGRVVTAPANRIVYHDP
jgi:hypothetical protein